MTSIQTVADSVGHMIEEQNDPHSHTERNPHRFHPSQIAHCKRQAYLRKLGLIDNSDYLGAMHVGTIIHEFIENVGVPHVAEALGVDEDDVYPEFEVEKTVDEVTFVGTADIWVPTEKIVIDWKSRASWYNFEPKDERYLDQISVYAAALGATHFGIVYLQKKDLETRTYPETEGFAEYDPERLRALLDKADQIRVAVEEHGIAESEDEVPFEPCDCYFCTTEELDFSGD